MSFGVFRNTRKSATIQEKLMVYMGCDSGLNTPQVFHAYRYLKILFDTERKYEGIARLSIFSSVSTVSTKSTSQISRV